MSHPSPYPSPPYTHPDNPDFLRAQHLYNSAWHVIIDQPPPPTLREILSAYRSKGDGDRDMLLAMLNAKSAEDQRIAALATLHQKLIELPQPHAPKPHIHDHIFPHPMPPPHHYHYPPPPPLSRVSPTASPRDLPLPSVQPPQNLNENAAQAPAPHSNPNSNPRKRARTSSSPPPLKRRHSGQSSESTELPPSPPFSSPGRSTLGPPELVAHPPSRDAMAIGSLLASDTHDQDTEWHSRTSSERDRDGAQRQSKGSAQGSISR
ncbi:hypothetical protein BU17DRAFT_81139 [Hysterangium stoloniferum]|nr:hypothetical protein BU17DRAFT_81139 [Hysterangium stoloniferum]